MGGVFPNSGELSHLLDPLREVSAMSIHNGFCCGVEISRASVIAEALPRAKHLIFRSARQRGEIGKSAQPLVIIRDDGGDLRLLKHELGNEDRVGIAGPAPGEIPSIPTIPTQQATTKFGRLESHRCTETNTDFSSWIAELVLICVSSVLICGVNEFIHARADATASGKASRFARGVRVRVHAEGVDHSFCAKEQAKRGGLREGTKGAGAGPG